MSRFLSVGTRCSMPKAPEALVRRPRLEGLLSDECRRPLTLVSAPPGAGKTTLLAGWLASAPVAPAAWVTVDAPDTGARLAELVAASLGRAGALDPGRVEGVSASGPELLDVVFEEILVGGRRCVLVLDDLQEAATRDALRTVAHLVEQAPPVLDVVLATRADPPLGWGRARLEGRLRQVRNDDLRFRPDEAAELLAGHGVRIGRQDTRALCDRTDGWAAGLQLAACALQSGSEPGRFVPSLTATQVAVADYLLTEVLDRQDEAARQFLLRTSVVDRLTPELAIALTGDARAGERLAALERRGIFLVELGDDGSYRYHALFATLLRARLRLADPDLVAVLHRRAADWNLAHGHAAEAEAHARSAGEWALVGRLALGRWLDAAVDAVPLADDPTAGVPPAVVLATPELALLAAAQACLRRQQDEADRLRRVVDRAQAPEADEPTTWATARAVLDLEYGRAFGGDDRTDGATRHLRDGSGSLLPRARRLACLREAERDLDAGRVAAARRSLQDLVDVGAPGPVTAEATAVLAVVDAAAGRLDAAERLASAALAATAPADGPTAVGDAARLALALCHAQRAEHRLAGDALAGVGEGTMPCRPLPAVHRIVRASQRRRRPGPITVGAPAGEHPFIGAALSALGVVETVDPLGRPRLHGGHGENVLAAARRRLAGAPGTPAAETLDGWLDGWLAGPGPGPGRGLGLRPGAGATTRPHPRTVLEAQLLSAFLADDRGDQVLACRRLVDALGVLRATGVRAPFVAHAARVAPLLDRYAGDLGPHGALAVELADRLDEDQATAIVVALTDRELRVLRNLPTLMSNVEIAEGLQVSVNTVKSHLKAVYRKLGVDGRRQAVLRGRALELI